MLLGLFLGHAGSNTVILFSQESAMLYFALKAKLLGNNLRRCGSALQITCQNPQLAITSGKILRQLYSSSLYLRPSLVGQLRIRPAAGQSLRVMRCFTMPH